MGGHCPPSDKILSIFFFKQPTNKMSDKVNLIVSDDDSSEDDVPVQVVPSKYDRLCKMLFYLTIITMVCVSIYTVLILYVIIDDSFKDDD
jgi:hypothetical protein